MILYLNNCGCGRKHCQESAALIVKSHFTKVTLKEAAIEFLIESLSLSLSIHAYTHTLTISVSFRYMGIQFSGVFFTDIDLKWCMRAMKSIPTLLAIFI